MDINKALLEKYELGLCTEQERLAVQEWLDNDSWDDLEITAEDETVKTEIWSNLSQHIGKGEENKVVTMPASRALWAGYAAAASVVLALGFFLWQQRWEEVQEDFYADNQHTPIAWCHEQNFDLLLSQNSSAHIDMKTGSISLSGNIMFKPKRDVTLHDVRNNQVFHFKQDQIYVLSEFPTENKFIVLQKDELPFLPPPIQRKLKKQFQIT